MSHSLLRPVAVGVLLALAGCGASSTPDSAAVPPAAQPEVLVQQEAAMAGGAMAKRMARPAPIASFAAMPGADSYPQGYRDESREQYQALADNPIHSVAETPVSTFSADVAQPIARSALKMQKMVQRDGRGIQRPVELDARPVIGKFHRRPCAVFPAVITAIEFIGDP